jgi:Mor family transcriptional regulator
MNRLTKSLNAQRRNGTLERNTTIALRVLAGDDVVSLAEEYGLSKAQIYMIRDNYRRNQEEARKMNLHKGVEK